MNVKDYQTIIKKTAIYPKEIGIAYCALGLTGEAGEVAEKIKKLYRDKKELVRCIENEHISDDELQNFVDFQEDITKELGDVLWYITALATEFDLDLRDIMLTNYNKLTKRKETNTLHGDGDNREDKT